MFLVTQYAEEYGAICFQLEHRFVDFFTTTVPIFVDLNLFTHFMFVWEEKKEGLKKRGVLVFWLNKKLH